MPNRRPDASRHILESKNPAGYHRLIATQIVMASVLFALGFVRVAPVENAFAAILQQVGTKLRQDKRPAPWWSYGIIVVALGLIVGIGWRVLSDG